MKCYRAVAAGLVKGSEYWGVCGLGVNRVVPSEHVANCLCVSSKAAVVDSQVKCYRAVAAGLVLLNKGGFGRRGGINRIVPSELVTSCLSVDSGIAVVDS